MNLGVAPLFFGLKGASVCKIQRIPIAIEEIANESPIQDVGKGRIRDDFNSPGLW
jgi:hypothetical protein